MGVIRLFHVVRLFSSDRVLSLKADHWAAAFHGFYEYFTFTCEHSTLRLSVDGETHYKLNDMTNELDDTRKE